MFILAHRFRRVSSQNKSTPDTYPVEFAETSRIQKARSVWAPYDAATLGLLVAA
jgi:hypothetical protein